MFSLSIFSTPFLDSAEIALFRAITRFMSTRMPPSISIPKSFARRAMCATRALATIALVGMQPVLTHVPPKRDSFDNRYFLTAIRNFYSQ